MIDVFEEGVIKVAKKYSNVVLIYGGCFCGCENFLKFFRDRSFNFGVGEQNLASAAVGFTLTGKTPLIVGSSGFVVDAYAQIRDGICIPNLNVKIVGIGGSDLPDVDLLNLLPNMKVLCPGSDEEVVAMIDEMMGEYGPVYLRLLSDKSI